MHCTDANYLSCIANGRYFDKWQYSRQSLKAQTLPGFGSHIHRHWQHRGLQRAAESIQSGRPLVGSPRTITKKTVDNECKDPKRTDYRKACEVRI